MAAVARSLTVDELDRYDHVPRSVAARVRLHEVPVLAPGTAGMTLGRHVLLRRGREDRRLVAHELVHVGQYAERGRARFLTRYLADYVGNLVRLRSHRRAYLAIPAEVEARDRTVRWTERHADWARGA